ncbi:MAG: CRISPR-associated endoribonuclease Cas6 [Bacteroidales bacterium]|jgi:CRISPR-associated endoribonuclease Cas6
MRFILKLYNESAERKVIPVNYQYPVSAWIYHTLGNADGEFAEKLHATGYVSGKQHFKNFTFSRLQFPPGGFKIDRDRLCVLSNEFQLVLSFRLPEITESFIKGLFAGSALKIYDKAGGAEFAVKSIECVSDPHFSDKMLWQTISPVIVSRPHERNGRLIPDYLEPQHKEYKKYFIQNLVRKAASADTVETDSESIGFKPVTEARKRGITLKAGTPAQTKVISYDFAFELVAPEALQKVLYHAGAGELNAQGFGCVKELNVGKEIAEFKTKDLVKQGM